MLRARQVTAQDFYNFDVIFTMDESNLNNLLKIAPSDATAKVMMFDDKAVADPYYGDVSDFDAMFEHIEQASRRWIDAWRDGDHHG